MTELSRRGRVLALLAARDRGRAAELLRHARAGAEGLASELNRPSVEREPILSGRAIARILEASDGSDESIARIARLVEFVRRISNHIVLMATTDPRALRSSRAATKDAKRDDPIGTVELWAIDFDPKLLGRRGGGKNLTSIRRWRALLSVALDRQLDRLVRPDESKFYRYATIAELLETACETAIAQLELGIARLRSGGNDHWIARILSARSGQIDILKRCEEWEARIEGLRALVPTRQDVRTAIDARRRAKTP